MSKESIGKKVNRLALKRQATTGETFEDAFHHILEADGQLAAQYALTMDMMDETPQEEGGVYSHLTSEQATQKMIQLTRDRMAATSERDFSRAMFAVLTEHPELAALHLQEEGQ